MSASEATTELFPDVENWTDDHTEVFLKLPEDFAEQIKTKVEELHPELSELPEQEAKEVRERYFASELFESLVSIEYAESVETEQVETAKELMRLMDRNSVLGEIDPYLRRPDLIAIEMHEDSMEVVATVEATLGMLGHRKYLQIVELKQDVAKIVESAQNGDLDLSDFPHLKKNISRLSVSDDHSTVIYMSGDKSFENRWEYVDDDRFPPGDWDHFEDILDGYEDDYKVKLVNSRFTSKQIGKITRKILNS